MSPAHRLSTGAESALEHHGADVDAAIEADLRYSADLVAELEAASEEHAWLVTMITLLALLVTVAAALMPVSGVAP